MQTERCDECGRYLEDCECDVQTTLSLGEAFHLILHANSPDPEWHEIASKAEVVMDDDHDGNLPTLGELLNQTGHL